MKTKFRNILIFLTSIILLLAAFAFWYTSTYSMEESSVYTINSEALPKKIAIATQGSTFKDAIVTNIVNQYKKDSVFIKVFDVTQLSTFSPDEYNAVVILHTWEYGSPPLVVSQFIENNTNVKEKLIVLATSGQGSNKMEGIDALAGESILENASDYADEIIEKIEKLIN